MKTTIKLLALAFVLFATACNNDDEMDMLNSLWRNVTQNEARIDALEKWCAQANTNISSLQTIVNVFESNDAITSITPIMEGGVEIGYTITFSNHDPITIYHGKDGKNGTDGKDGQNGANGQNGTSPIVGVAQSGGVYYWTLNGEWLLDADGNKLPVSGKDGVNGENGQNGSNGQNGVTPQLKIENDYWWISYDNGSTWTQLGKAKGEDGENGQNGAKGDKGDTGDKGDKGDKGDSMFQSVTQDADNVYFTLANGTVITIAKGSGGADDGGYIFTITYMPNGGVGEVVVDTVFYGESYSIRGYLVYTKEGYYIGSWNTNPDGHGTDFHFWKIIAVSRNITLYAQWREERVLGIENGYYYVDLGLPSGLKWATCNVGATAPEDYGNYYAWGETTTKSTYNWGTYKWGTAEYNSYYGSWKEILIFKYNTDSDGTFDHKTVLDPEDDVAYANWGCYWRMPTDAEWTELLENCEWTWTDDYSGTGGRGQIVTGLNGNHIFLPSAGYRNDRDLNGAGAGYYWSSSLNTDDSCYAYGVRFYASNNNVNIIEFIRPQGYPVRPVFGE